MSDASHRFQLVAQPAHDPGEDIITRSTVGPFVDCGAWIPPSPRRRRVYLTVETIRQLAEAAGIVEARGNSEAAIKRAYAEGGLDILKENIGGDLVRVLGRLAGVLADAELPAEPADGEAGDPADGSE